MFESLDRLPRDPILGLSQAFRDELAPEKVDLGVGVYRDDTGGSPIFSAVKAAESDLLADQKTKAYVSQAGDPVFLESMAKLIVGDELFGSHRDRLVSLTSVGGSGAIRLAAEVALAAKPDTKAWVCKPTWAHHLPLLAGAGMQVEEYGYYDDRAGTVNFDKMMADLAHAKAGDLVVLQVSCHNPTGADLSQSQWSEVVDLAARRGFVPLLDIAYQGFGDSLDEDAFAIRLAISQLPELIVANSCAKNFGLYRERPGMLLIQGRTADEAQAAGSHVLTNARRTYSMPGYHGPAIVGQLLSDETLRSTWTSELTAARTRVSTLRKMFATELNNAQSRTDYSFLADQKGMFSLLGLDKSQIKRLREDHSIYMLGNSRANIAGLTPDNIEYVVRSVVSVTS